MSPAILAHYLTGALAYEVARDRLGVYRRLLRLALRREIAEWRWRLGLAADVPPPRDAEVRACLRVAGFLAGRLRR